MNSLFQRLPAAAQAKIRSLGVKKLSISAPLSLEDDPTVVVYIDFGGEKASSDVFVFPIGPGK